MKYSNDYRSEGEEKKRSSKGFYIALAVCLVAVAGVAVVTFWNDSPAPGDNDILPTTTTSARAATTTTTVQQVVVPATGVPDDRTTQTTAKTTATVTTTTVNAGDLFVFPVSNTVIRDYSEDLIFSETLGEWRTHNGVDFAAEKGAQVKAVADGTIKAIGEDPLWGGMVEIDHGDKLISRCYGVTAKDLKVGQTVKAGQGIGTVCDIPSEILDEPHLHLEVLVNGNYQNPMTLIRGSVVRKTQGTTAVTTTKK